MLPDPTTLQSLAQLPNTGGRLSSTWNELLRVMKEALPPLIDYINENGVDYYGNKMNLPKPIDYFVDGEEKEDIFPSLLVGLSPQTQVMGIDGNLSLSNGAIYIQMPPQMTRRDCDDSMDIAQLIVGVLLAVQLHWIDPQGRVSWASIQPTAIALGPNNKGNFGGYAVRFNMYQFPKEDLWLAGSETPSDLPTSEEIAKSLHWTGGRVTCVWNAFLDIFNKKLNDIIATANSTYDINIPADRNGNHITGGYQIIQEFNKEANFPKILVGATLTFEASTERSYTSNLQVSVFTLHNKNHTRRQLDDSGDIVNLQKALMTNFQGGFVSDEGKRIWTNLEEKAEGVQTPDLKDYDFSECHFTVTQYNDTNMWLPN